MKQLLYFVKKLHIFSGKIIYFNLISMILIGLVEGIGIFMLIPLIGVTGIFHLPVSDISIIAMLTSLFRGMPETISLTIILGAYVLLIVAQSFFKRYQTILSVKIQQGFIRHLKEETYNRIIYANWNFFLKRRRSDIINLMTTEIFRVSGGTNLFFQFLSSVIFTFIQVSLAMWISFKMTALVLFFGIALIITSRKFIKKSQTLGSESVRLSKEYLAGMTDHLNGIKEIKSNSLEETHAAWFLNLNKKIEKNIVNFARLSTKSQLIYQVISALLIAVFVFLSIKMFKAQPAQLMIITVIFSRLWPKFSGIQANLEQIAAVLPSFKALLDLQKEGMEEREQNPGDHQNIKPLSVKEGIECSDLYFKYNQEKLALENINLYIPSNGMTAIVGRSGAGKSTLVDILMGLNRPEKGKVSIDGVTVEKEHLISLRKSISYVPQDPFLFNTTIRENLLLNAPNAKEESLWEALEFSAAADFIRKLPEGLDTLIGDRGIRLSGGERQRIVLARAILRKPSILILDEATSALDSENESKIQQALEKMKGKITIIIIAHRLSTIRNADQLIVLDNGRIIQKGGYHQLSNEKGGVFRELLFRQLG
ncbi:ABC transporter ATP-binding protein [Peribacillus kribbensis]|uniref:ABC transporter ATP-binding protein n=1 Tax=Peribacillus kribbensis TaxID=356658 RepID=UPI000415DD71|nr:ABC transporter ATP-binding protein [Peribacillus kribbensis]